MHFLTFEIRLKLLVTGVGTVTIIKSDLLMELTLLVKIRFLDLFISDEFNSFVLSKFLFNSSISF